MCEHGLTMLLRHGASRPSDTAQRHNRAVAWSSRVKRWSGHLSDVAAGCAFVLGKMTKTLDVAGKIEKLFFIWIRCARALGRSRLGALKPSPRITSSARRIQFRLFIFVSSCGLLNA